jgi:hypothetical protein
MALTGRRVKPGAALARVVPALAARKPDEELADRGDELSEEDLALVAGGGIKGSAGQGGDEN